jgi:hypothetical protein
MIFSHITNKPRNKPEVAVLVQGMRSEKAFAVNENWR